MFSNKLDLNSKREWEGLCIKKEKVSCDEFLIFLAERCQILENLEAHNVVKLNKLIKMLIIKYIKVRVIFLE